VATLRSSRQSRSWVWTSWLETSWRKWRRTSAIRACCRDSRRMALALLRERGCVKETRRDSRRRRNVSRRSGMGDSNRATSDPSEVAATANAERPRSTPTNPSVSPTERDR
jgi:hypothetical protein